MKVRKFGLVLLATSMLTGCGILPYDALKTKEKEVTEYNTMLTKTLGSYAQNKILADSEKEKLLSFILKDEVWALASQSGITLDVLKEEELTAFKVKGIVYDEYFTSLGADALREVLIITGKDYRMYVTVIWGKNTIHSIDRVVKKNAKV
jgi:hypothetical protein